MSRVVIAGGSGFLGQALAAALAKDGSEIILLSRNPAVGPQPQVGRPVAWNPTGSAGPWAAELDGADAVVNLAGESIAARRWLAAQKARIRDSRILATRSLTDAMGRMHRRPATLINGSAVGFYGACGDEEVTEQTPAGRDFLADVCVRWEAEATSAAPRATRVVCVRTGLVLDRRNGALPRMLLPFRLGVGGPVGSGRQYWPWIHIADWVDLVRFAIRTTAIEGPLNATSPTPVTNRAFARALGRALRRPALVPTPALALKLLLGEMADALLLTGQRAIPAKGLQHGFTFRFATVDEALQDIFSGSSHRASAASSCV
jgi:hypothetical protein